MAWRLNDWVECGELFNTRNYSTLGWIKFKGVKTPLRLELTGNTSPDLQGWHLYFEARPPKNPEAMRTRGEIEGTEGLTKKDLKKLAPQQIGSTGDMTASRMVRTFDCTIDEFLARCRAGEPPRTEWKRGLYLEWFSQNGRVVIELSDPVLEFIEYVGRDGKPQKLAPPEPEPIPPCDENGRPLDPGEISVTAIRLDEDGEADIQEVTPEDLEEAKDRDPYGLLPDDLQSQLDAQTRKTDRSLKDGREDEDDEDPDRMMRETELMDHLITHEDGELLKDLLPGKPKLYNPDKLGDEEVEGELKGLISVMAMIGIAFDVCEHCSPREAYRILVKEVLKKQRGYPQLKGTQWVQHYGTHDYCKECDAEAERDYRETKDKIEKEMERGDAEA
jgi:hypothetical protein